LMQVLRHDYQTFTHSTNVSFFGVMLARAWGVSDRNDLERIAAGALLHDIGKLDIPDALLTKRGRPTEKEWETLKKHPTTGFHLLARRDDLTLGQLMMVYQHHERLDGGGYPVGVTEKEIHPWAQLCAVVDVYEALSSHRPYRPAMPLRETIGILERQVGGQLNPDMWRCWKQIISSD
ncbi:MAG: HD domain-containing phosphohydrolase, partial [Planctomycetota bacterium]